MYIFIFVVENKFLNKYSSVHFVKINHRLFNALSCTINASVSTAW